MAIFISLSVTDKTTSKQDAATVRTALLEEAVGALQPIFGARGASATRIQAVLGRSPDKDATFSLSVHLHLPGQRIVAVHSKGDDLRSLARDVIDKLTSATRRHLERLANGTEFARKRRRERLYEITTGADQRPERERSLVEARLAEIRPKLETAARRELAYLRAVSKLPTGYPEVADIVDEAIMRVIASDYGVVDAGELQIAALRELFAVIDAEIAAQQISMSAIPLDSEVPQDAEDEAEAMVEEEFYEFYQPDDHVTLADVLPVELSQTKVALDEVHVAGVVAALRDLPNLWRRVFVLRQQDLFAPKQVSEVVDRALDEIEDIFEKVSAFLDARLAEWGADSWEEIFRSKGLRCCRQAPMRTGV